MKQSKLFLLSSTDFQALSAQLQEDIYNEYYQFVYSSIIFMVRDHATTEDIIQVSFLKVIQKIPHGLTEIQLKGWIKVVVRNCVHNYFRKTKKSRNDIDSDSVYISESIVYATESASLEREIETKLMTEEIGQCLNEMKPEYKALIELRWKKDLSYREMATELDTSEDTVKYKLYRAREALKKKLFKRWGDSIE
ncbi:sigma-70 family RNA polymerase sigma factor [Paenibacillus sp. GSMTC-2017]|uniref:RNA polymerase sigma factor n=1 Tax=Paenibacillus sp. GSMTC-2017 TaxID=2794350 RepID=UPI0018D7A192|nr:sigma-70 family RNA polymerase sigma factor [Paenibacillus sp. GSMTC-2017]MBH5320457.1 sigma-70 family RNA polymerase sigma factor [Paenibacillus sp. GSMTC-2017]